MDIRQQCLYCTLTYTNITAYITHLRHDHTERMVYIFVWTLADDGFAIALDSIPPPLVHELYCNPFLHHSDHDSSYADADCNSASIDADKSSVYLCISDMPHFDTHQAGKHVRTEYVDIFDNGIDLGSLISATRSID